MDTSTNIARRVTIKHADGRRDFRTYNGTENGFTGWIKATQDEPGVYGWSTQSTVRHSL